MSVTSKFQLYELCISPRQALSSCPAPDNPQGEATPAPRRLPRRRRAGGRPSGIPGPALRPRAGTHGGKHSTSGSWRRNKIAVGICGYKPKMKGKILSSRKKSLLDLSRVRNRRKPKAARGLCYRYRRFPPGFTSNAEGNRVIVASPIPPSSALSFDRVAEHTAEVI
jgi:hypothetical protein